MEQNLQKPLETSAPGAAETLHWVVSWLHREGFHDVESALMQEVQHKVLDHEQTPSHRSLSQGSLHRNRGQNTITTNNLLAREGSNFEILSSAERVVEAWRSKSTTPTASPRQVITVLPQSQAIPPTSPHNSFSIDEYDDDDDPGYWRVPATEPGFHLGLHSVLNSEQSLGSDRSHHPSGLPKSPSTTSIGLTNPSHSRHSSVDIPRILLEAPVSGRGIPPSSHPLSANRLSKTQPSPRPGHSSSAEGTPRPTKAPSSSSFQHQRYHSPGSSDAGDILAPIPTTSGWNSADERAMASAMPPPPGATSISSLTRQNSEDACHQDGTAKWVFDRENSAGSEVYRSLLTFLDTQSPRTQLAPMASTEPSDGGSGCHGPSPRDRPVHDVPSTVAGMPSPTSSELHGRGSLPDGTRSSDEAKSASLPSSSSSPVGTAFPTPLMGEASAVELATDSSRMIADVVVAVDRHADRSATTKHSIDDDGNVSRVSSLGESMTREGNEEATKDASFAIPPPAAPVDSMDDYSDALQALLSKGIDGKSDDHLARSTLSASAGLLAVRTSKEYSPGRMEEPCHGQTHHSKDTDALINDNEEVESDIDDKLDDDDDDDDDSSDDKGNPFSFPVTSPSEHTEKAPAPLFGGVAVNWPSFKNLGNSPSSRSSGLPGYSTEDDTTPANSARRCMKRAQLRPASSGNLSLLQHGAGGVSNTLLGNSSNHNTAGSGSNNSNSLLFSTKLPLLQQPIFRRSSSSQSSLNQQQLQNQQHQYYSSSGTTRELPMGQYKDSILYEYDEDAIDARYDIFDLRIIHRRNATGFEVCRDLPLRINDLIAGRYQIVDLLGQAAFSRAVQAIDIKTGELVCLKVVRNNKDYLDQSLDEIKILRYVNAADPLDECGVLRLYDFFYFKEHLILVTELLRANLYEFSKHNRESSDQLYFTLARIQSISIQLLHSLQFLHSLGLIHADLKPENILMKSYSACQVKVIDLGSSCFLSDRLSLYVQSRSYRAPEVILGLPYGNKIDIWSLGCIIAELLTGNVLFTNTSISAIVARIEGIIGKIPWHMVQRGKYSHMYFTKDGMIYDKNKETGQVEILRPKKSSLAHRLPGADALLIDFVNSLLTIDPAKRPSAEEALQHPWLQVKY